MRLSILGVLLTLLLPRIADAACHDIMFEGIPYTLCDVAASDDIRLFQQAADGRPYGTFDRVNEALAVEGAQLGFAMNAGMYHPDRAPVGLMIEEGQQRAPIVTSAGPGNFGLLPNGVFCIGESFHIIESRAFAANPPACRFATQSGPMLVIDGALHPRFLPDSTSFYIRNGVGVSADGRTATFAISNRRVTFDQFGRLFRDALKLPNALYFDGSISRLYDAGRNRFDWGSPMGPMVGSVIPKR